MASGQLYIEDGESSNPNATCTVDLSVADGTLHASRSGTYMDNNSLGNVTIMGVEDIGSVKLNGNTILGGAAYQLKCQSVKDSGFAARYEQWSLE